MSNREDFSAMPDEMLDKQILYAEGVRHGFHAAIELVDELSGGKLSLNAPETIRSWERREARMRDERSVRNASRRSQAAREKRVTMSEDPSHD